MLYNSTSDAGIPASNSLYSRFSRNNCQVNLVNQINNNITSYQNDMYDISTYIATSRVVSSFLLTGDYANPNSQIDFSVRESDLNDLMMNLVVTKNYLNLMVLFKNSLDFPSFYNLNDSSTGINPFPQIKENSVYKSIYEKSGGTFWFSIGKGSNFILQNNKNPKLVLGRLVKNSNDYSAIGLLLVGTNEQEISKIFRNNLQSSKEGIIITDSEGNVISKAGFDFFSNLNTRQPFIAESAKQKSGYIVDNIKAKKMLVAFSSDNPAGWKIYYAVPTDMLTGEIRSLNILTFFVIIVCIFLSLPLILFTTNFITSPIKTLLKSMIRFQKGNFEEKVLVEQNDEIGQLSLVYNSMVSHIKDLIEQNYVLKINEQKAELNALQAQINPHFLYNTLDTIYWRAQSNGQKDLSKMVYSLAKFFRLSLNRGKGLTLVSKEKELLEHYLLLQKIRFQEKLNYEIDIEDKILDFIIPKLIIQPFVENSLLHGLEGKENGGNIIIIGKSQEDFVCFSIEDDGIGMDENTIQKILSGEDDAELEESGSLGGYAVRNVNSRLRLHYKDQYSLVYTSQLGIGTKVELRIPAVKNLENAEVSYL